MIAIYARQSVEKKDSISIEQQIEMCKRCADSAAVEVYSDAGFSGKNTARPDFQRMLQDVENGLVNKVICYRLDRISRNLLDFANVWELLQKRKVEFVSVSEQFDTTTPIGKAMVYIAMVFAQMERETISQRITDNYYTRTAHGAWGGGQPPFGFKLSRRLIDGKMQAALEPIPHDIDIAKWMFEEYATGIRSLGWIASGVYDKHPTRDTRWTNVSVRRILKNPIYAAADADLYAYFAARGINIASSLTAFDGTQTAVQVGSRSNDTRVRKPLADQQLCIFPADPVVSSATWIAVQKNLSANKQIKNSGKGKYSWLSGKLKCASCGYSCTAHYDKKVKRVYLQCTGRYRQSVKAARCETRHTERIEDIEAAVLAQLKEYMSDAEPAQSGVDARTEQRRNELKLQLIDAQQKQSNVAAAIADGGAEVMRLMLPEIKRLDEQVKDITQQLAELTEAPRAAWSKDSYFDLDELTRDQLRDLAALTINNVYISPTAPPRVEWK
nr:MAG TPA: integrase [Caudoviricetes sp.]